MDETDLRMGKGVLIAVLGAFILFAIIAVVTPSNTDVRIACLEAGHSVEKCKDI